MYSGAAQQPSIDWWAVKDAAWLSGSEENAINTTLTLNMDCLQSTVHGDIAFNHEILCFKIRASNGLQPKVLMKSYVNF